MPNLLSSTRRRRTETARLAGVVALGVVAQIAVDVPEGYLGPRDATTPWGVAYASTLVAAGLAAAIAQRRRWRAAAWIGPVLYALNVGVFLPAFVADPVVAGSVMAWNLTLLAQALLPPVGSSPRPAGATPAAEWLARNGPALQHLAVASLLLTLGVVGYRLSGHPWAQGMALAVNSATLALAVPLLWKLRGDGHPALYLVAAPAAASLTALARPGIMLPLLALSQAVLLGVLVAQRSGTGELLRSFYDRPSRLVVGSFATVILVGTVLLTFPAASSGPQPIAPLDAFFTATSATCVTGLIVLDTPVDLSTLGHVFLLLMIQAGGLGIMVLGTFGTLLLGGSLGLRGERALSEMLELETGPTAYRLTRFIVLTTLGVEAVGAAGLAAFFRSTGMGWGEALWQGVFHAVSAFCNAGFALHSDSLVMFQSSPGAQLLVVCLVVVGGLGFAVLAALGRRVVQRDGGELGPVNTQVRVVVAATVMLVVAGTLLFTALEWNRTLADLAVPDKLVNALFQSVTLRTAGFNTVDLARLAPASILFMMVFMFIGASPGSTGGGIKTTTAAVLLAAIRATGRRDPVHLFDREVPRDVVHRSLAILVISAAIVLGSLFLILLVESQPFLVLAFEVVSAFGTVGLSLGATAALGPVGKLLIVAVMFAGRVGPLTLALLLGAGAARGAVYHQPPTRLMVG